MITSPTAADSLLDTDTPSAWTTAEFAAVSRRSVRKFTDKPLTDTQINELLALVGRAPSAFNVQPWRFVVVRDETVKRELQGAAYNQPQVAGAPVVIAMYADMEDAIANATTWIDECSSTGQPMGPLLDHWASARSAA